MTDRRGRSGASWTELGAARWPPLGPFPTAESTVSSRNRPGNGFLGMPHMLGKVSLFLALLCLLPTACGQLGAARAHQPSSEPSRLVAVQQPEPCGPDFPGMLRRALP
jgi:hypothetical protein